MMLGRHWALRLQGSMLLNPLTLVTKVVTTLGSVVVELEELEELEEFEEPSPHADRPKAIEVHSKNIAKCFKVILMRTLGSFAN
jgi:hypothetical protein